MNTKKITMVVTLLAISLLSGCATNYAQNVVKSGSSAYIKRYSGYKAEHQPVVDADSLGGISLFSILQLAAAGYAGSIDGIGGAVTSLAIDESVANRHLRQGEYNMLFSWLPASYGSTPDEVEAKYAEQVSSVVKTVLNDHDMAFDLDSPIISKGGYGRSLYSVYGDKCGEQDAPQCLVELTFSGKLIQQPALSPAPAIIKDLDGRSVWAVTTRGGAQVAHRSVALLAPPALGVDVERVYREVSRRLPGQSYMYIAKSPTFNVPTGDPGKIKGYYYALHDGNEMSFDRK